MAKLSKAEIELVSCEDFIVDAARPLLGVCDQLADYPRVNENVSKARRHVEKAMRLLDDAYAGLR